jgi:hypothetical protein
MSVSTKTIHDYSQNANRLVLLQRNWNRLLIGIAAMLAIVYLGFAIILPIDHFDHYEVEHALVTSKRAR